MKLCRFQTSSSRPRVGLLKNDSTVLDLSAEGIDRLTSLFEFEGLSAQLGALALRLHAVGPLRAQARWLGTLAVLQLGTGLANVVLGWPLVAALFHTAGAAGLALVLTWTVARSTADAAARSASSPVAGSPGVSA